MYKISYEKCVCFIFIVILAVLSCSGFRIDNLAMTDISKKNSHTSSNSLLNSDNKLLDITAASPVVPVYNRRIRHHRQLRAQAHTFPQLANERLFPPQQIPISTDVQHPIIPTHTKRSNDHRRNRKQQQQHSCPEYDASWKAFKSNIVVIAKEESISHRRNGNYTVLFKVVKKIKSSSFPVDDHITVKFSSDTSTNCEYDDRKKRQHHLVKAQIERSKEYILFLNAYGAHNYSAVFEPEPRRKKTLLVVNKVTNPSFRPKPIRIEMTSSTETRSKRLKLVCKVKGLPIPIIYWKRNNTLLSPNSHVRITNRNDGKDRRRNTLVIRNLTEADSDTYACVARDVDGKETSKLFRPTTNQTPIREKPDRGMPCDEAMASAYCMNGGTCFLIQSLAEYGCECATGYTGKQCDQKSSETSSTYRQTPIYTCKIGLYTKYDNC